MTVRRSRLRRHPAAAATEEVTFGTAYYPDHWPQSDWERDLDRIADTGIRSVRFGEFSWSWYEPRPGEFTFDAFDRFVDAVEARELRLCLCTPTATPPPWFDRLFPDGRLQDMHGRRCLSHRHFWCWNHPAASEKAADTIRTLALRYRNRPCLWGWQIDNEPNYAEQIHRGAPESMYDHNPYARRAWVAWLRERYHDSLDALNAAWWTNFWSQRHSDWEELLLPRGRVNPHAWLDWMRWREHNLASFVHRQRDLLRTLTPGKAIGCNIPETGVEFSLQIGQDYWAQADGLDWVGTDLYRATGSRDFDLRRHAYSTDLLRSAAEATGARFLVSETQAGPHERAWPNSFAGEGFGPDYLQQCARVYAGHGAQEIWWFLWRGALGGHELGMNGLQELSGDASPRTAAVRSLARTGAQLAACRARFRRRPRAVVHYSRDSLRFWTGVVNDAQPLEDTIAGWHQLLEAAGFRVDFADDASLVGGAHEDVLVLPYTLIASDPLVEAIARHPGLLLAGPHTAVANQHGHLRAERLPLILQQRLGLRFGLWRDTPPLPQVRGLPKLTGWRELLPDQATKSIARLSNRASAVARSRSALTFAFDAGALASRSTRGQQARLITLLQDGTQPLRAKRTSL